MFHNQVPDKSTSQAFHLVGFAVTQAHIERNARSSARSSLGWEPCEREGRSRFAQWTVAIAIAAWSAVLLIVVLGQMDRGFDFTDDAFYLMWAQAPKSYAIALGFFGYGLHALFELTGESVAGLRQLGAALAVGVAGLTAAIAVRRLQIRPWTPFALQIAISSAVLPLSYYVFWIPTPSYNWFALIGEFLLLCALLHLDRAEHLARSGLFVALSGLCMFFSRPQNAAAFAAIYLCAAWPASRKGLPIRRALISGGAGTLALISIFVWWASFDTLVNQVLGYRDTFGLAHPGGATFLGQLSQFASGPGASFVVSIGVFGLVSLLDRLDRLKRWMMVFPAALAAILAAKVAYAIGLSDFVYRIGPAAGSLTYLLLSLCRFNRGSDSNLLDVLGWASLLPLAATVGSGDRIAEQLAFFCGLWGVVGAIAVAQIGPRVVFAQTALAAAWLSVVSVAIYVGLSSPYRLAAPVWSQTTPTLLSSGGQLRLDDKTSRFIKAIQDSARESGFCKGDAMLDLGSASPGLIFALGGQARVFPWILAGYSFSEGLAKKVVDRISPAERDRTWLVVSDAPHTLSRSQIGALGIDLSSYKLVVQLTHPVTGYPINLFAPKSLGRC